MLLEVTDSGIMASVNFLEIVKYTFKKVGMLLGFFYQQAVGLNVSALCNEGERSIYFALRSEGNLNFSHKSTLLPSSSPFPRAAAVGKNGCEPVRRGKEVGAMCRPQCSEQNRLFLSHLPRYFRNFHAINLSLRNPIFFFGEGWGKADYTNFPRKYHLIPWIKKIINFI